MMELQISQGRPCQALIILSFMILICAYNVLFESTTIGGSIAPCHSRTARVGTNNQVPISSPFQSESASDWSFQPRAYPKVEKLPCLQANGNMNDPGDDLDGNKYTKNTLTTHGFLFVKPLKVGGSTVLGVQLRIQQKRNCTAGSFEHAQGSAFAGRVPQDSFLYSWLRDPTERVISEFFHLQVSRNRIEPKDVNFMEAIKKDAVRSKDYFLKIHAMKELPPYKKYNQALLSEQEKRDFLLNYDFIGVAERFDESVVVMQLLLGLKTSEVLYLRAKSSGGFDDGEFNNKCIYIVPSFVSPGMKEYFESEEWQDRIRNDLAIYRAANASLDRTIDDTIGRPVFEKALSKFRRAQELVQNHCAPITRFPCSRGGKRRSKDQTDCLWSDSGCGHDCMDRVVRDAHLEDFS